MDITSFFQSIFGFSIWLPVKIMFLVGFGVYIVFAFVVVRQVKLMTGVVSGLLSGFLQLLSWLLFLFSVFVFVVAILFL